MKNNAINIYDAEGRLAVRSYGTLEWVTTDLGFTSHTYQAYREERRVDYVGELTLEDGDVCRRTHEAGWTDAQGREVAAVHDYRGSLRATWTDTSTGTSGTGGGTTAPFIPGTCANTKIYGNLTGYYPYGLPWADWQGTDRYLFSGKELEREHGLFTYDFHARPYDPGLCRFTQPDPMATKYERLNAFLYCAANPISFTDPTGCEFIAGDEHTKETFKNIVYSIFPKDCLSINFDMNNAFSSTFNKDAAKKTPFYKELCNLNKGLVRLQHIKPDVQFLYVGPETEVEGKSMQEDGGFFMSDKNLMYICDDWDVDFTILVSEEDHPKFGKEIDISENTVSTSFHEFMEAMTKGEDRSKVIDYENNVRKIQGLPLRPYDVKHKPFRREPQKIIINNEFFENSNNEFGY